jgi:hypothetical protein
MNSHSRSVRPRLAASLSSWVSDGMARLPFSTRRCVTAAAVDLEPLDDAQLAQVAGGLDSPFLPGDEWTGPGR